MNRGSLPRPLRGYAGAENCYSCRKVLWLIVLIMILERKPLGGATFIDPGLRLL